MRLRRSPRASTRHPRLLYLSLHTTGPGQAGWADIDEVVVRLRDRGWTVDLRQPSYIGKAPPGAVRRLAELLAMQVRAAPRLTRFDALYVRSHVLAFPLAFLARLAGVPVIQECNGPTEDLFIAWPQLRPLRRPLVFAMRAQYRWATEIVTVTPQLARWLEQESGRSHVTVIPNGANTELFAPGALATRDLPARYAVFFGSLAPWQGIVTMLAATEHEDWPPGVELVIAGDGVLRDAVQQAAERGRVVYLGSCPQPELPGIVAGAIASLVVKDHPAHAASGLSPLKLYESMAAGVPVVGSALPGLEDVVTRFECGLVVPAGDPGAVARAVAAIANSPDARARMGEAGRRAALAEYSWDTVANATARVIGCAIRARNA